MVLLIVTGCIQDALVPCDDQLCPVGSLCTPIGCATPDQIAACEGLADGEACGTNGVCTQGVCEPIVCGDGKITGPEVCDDRNQRAGDDCSADCLSDETCGNGYADGIAGEQCDEGIRGLSGDGCTSTCEIELATWSEVTPKFPTRRYRQGTVYDVARNEIVIFGGLTTNASAFLGDTWVLRGGTWHRRMPAHSPPPRAAAAMVYDEVRRRTILFGGEDFENTFDDTWEWDGVDWTQLHPASSPSARAFPAAAFDRVGERVVLFGGTDLSGLMVYQDSWIWDGVTWALLSSTASPPAFVGAMAFDPPTNELVLFVTSGETWTLAGSSWQKRSPAASPPSPRSAALVGSSPLGVILFGGLVSGFPGTVSDMYRWSGGTWQTITTTPAPGSRSGGPLVYDPIRDRVVLVQSAFFPAPDDATWEWAGSWTSYLPTLSPSPRTRYLGAYNPRTGRTLLTGGVSAVDTWEWTGDAWEHLPTTTTPAPTIAALAATRTSFLLIGSTGTWTWDGADWSKLAPVHDPSLRPLGAAYDRRRDRVVIYAPNGAATNPPQTWEWTGDDWEMQTPAHEPTSTGYLAYDDARGVTVMYGGLARADGSATDETWEWDGVDWTLRSPPARPGRRTGVAMTYDDNRKRVVLFGGTSTLATPGGLDDTWEWDGTTWTRVDDVFIPPARYNAFIAFDSARQQIVLYGGASGLTSLEDTWIHRFTSVSHPPDACLEVDTDGDGLAGCADPDCWGRCAPYCPPQTSCDPALPHCGDGTCSEVENHRLCPTDCTL